MLVSQLDERFEVVSYAPNRGGRAEITLVEGQIKLRIPYTFYTDLGTESPSIAVNGEATQQQLDDLRSILANVLQATNDEIESQHGWTRYVDLP